MAKVLELRKRSMSGNAIWRELRGTEWAVGKTTIQDIIRAAAAEPGSDVEPLHQNEGLKVATLTAAQVAANLRVTTQETLMRVAAKSAAQSERVKDALARMSEDVLLDQALNIKHLNGAANADALFALKYVAATSGEVERDDSALDNFEDAMFTGAQVDYPDTAEEGDDR